MPTISSIPCRDRANANHGTILVSIPGFGDSWQVSPEFASRMLWRPSGLSPLMVLLLTLMDLWVCKIRLRHEFAA